MINKIKKILSLILIFLAPLWSYYYFNVLNISSNVNTKVYFTAYECADSSCVSINNNANLEIYDYEKVKDCFTNYKVDNIDSCISGGKIDSLFLEKGKNKIIVFKIELPDANQHYYDIIVNPDNAIPYAVKVTVNDWNSYTPYYSYINDVYYFIHNLSYKPNPITLYKYDGNNSKGIVINNFNIQNEIEVKHPLFIRVPAEVNSAICSEIKNKNVYYIPPEILNIKTTIMLTIKDEEGNIVKEDTKDIYVDPTQCNLNYEYNWVPEKEGKYTVTITAEITDPRFINVLGDKVKQEVKAYNPSSQFCYTNLREIKLNDLDTDFWTLESDEAAKVSFKVLSGENDGTGTIVSKPTMWEIYIDNVKIFSGITASSYEYKTIEKDLTDKLTKGTHNLTIKAWALQCSYEDNEPAIFSKEIRVLEDDDNSEISNTPPQIISFDIDKTNGTAPLTVTFSFQVFDNENSNLKVTIAYDGCITTNCNYETFNISDFTQTISRNYTYTEPGIYHLIINVSDGEKYNYIERTIIVEEVNETITPTPTIKEFTYEWNDSNGNNKIDENEQITFKAAVECNNSCIIKFTLFNDNGEILIKNESEKEGNINLEYGPYSLLAGNYSAQLNVENNGGSVYRIITLKVESGETEQTSNTNNQTPITDNQTNNNSYTIPPTPITVNQTNNHSYTPIPSTTPTTESKSTTIITTASTINTEEKTTEEGNSILTKKKEKNVEEKIKEELNKLLKNIHINNGKNKEKHMEEEKLSSSKTSITTLNAEKVGNNEQTPLILVNLGAGIILLILLLILFII